MYPLAANWEAMFHNLFPFRYFLTKAAYYNLLSDKNINKTIESNQLSLEIEHNNKQHKKDNTSDSD